MDVKMVETSYNAETDELKITIDDVEEVVDFKEFMDGIPTERARLEYLLSMIKDVKEKRLTRIDEFMGTIEEIMKKQASVRQSMEATAAIGDHKAVRSLSMVHKALLDEKNTLREIRYAIKLLENDEGKLMAELLELTS